MFNVQKSSGILNSDNASAILLGASSGDWLPFDPLNTFNSNKKNVFFQLKSLLTVDGDKLIQTQTEDNGRKSTHVRTFTPETLTVVSFIIIYLYLSLHQIMEPRKELIMRRNGIIRNSKTTPFKIIRCL